MLVRKRQQSQYYAAIDLGSNSFHMIVAQDDHGQLKIIDRLREPIRLGQSITEDWNFTDDGINNAIACLERFGQRLRGISSKSVRIVGTNALRIANNSKTLLRRAEEFLGNRIEIISGIEEARLTYLGVISSLHSNDPRLLIDIGGSSSEIIKGVGKVPTRLTSVNMGCVTWTKEYFPDGKLTSKRFKRAILDANVKLETDKIFFQQHKGVTAFGSSGTIKAITRLIQEYDINKGELTYESLQILKETLIQCETLDKVASEVVSEERIQVLPGGLSVLIAIFESLEISSMQLAEGALREGILFDLWGRSHNADVREETVMAMSKRYSIDEKQASNVSKLSLKLLESMEGDWDFSEELVDYLRWSSLLHEIGISIAHSQYQRHGAYILSNADMAGFSQLDQALVSTMVRNHRKKPDLDSYSALPPELQQQIIQLSAILRFAVIFMRGRDDLSQLPITISATETSLTLDIDNDWIENHPLTRSDLEQEKKNLKSLGIKLKLPFLTKEQASV